MLGVLWTMTGAMDKVEIVDGGGFRSWWWTVVDTEGHYPEPYSRTWAQGVSTSTVSTEGVLLPWQPAPLDWHCCQRGLATAQVLCGSIPAAELDTGHLH